MVVPKKTTSKAKMKTLRPSEEAAARINAARGAETILLSSQARSKHPGISSGSIGLDRALGTGGYALGRIVEIFGSEASGKTTLTLHAVASAQAMGGVAGFVDAEHALDPNYAASVGVKMTDLLLSQPMNAEEALDTTLALTEDAATNLVVVDSVAALVPLKEVEGGMGDAHMGLHARLMSQALRKLASIASRAKTTVIFVNQLRSKIGVIYGSPEVTTGGNALKYYASQRIDVRRREHVKSQEGEGPVGNATHVRVIKNKLSPPFTEVDFEIIWGRGIDFAGDLLNVAVSIGVVDRRGSHFFFAEKRIAHGWNNAASAIRLDPELTRLIIAEVNTT